MFNLTQRNKLMTEFPNPDKYFAESVYESKPKGTIVYYHHTLLWIPTQYGWVRAITKNFSTSWPGLSSDLMQKYLTKKQSTILGNLQQPRKGLLSTQKNKSSQNQSHNLNQDNTNLPHPCSNKIPMLSPSRQWI